MAENFFGKAALCVVGNVNRDVKVHQVPRSGNLLKDGETSVPAITESIGGGGANSACAAAALGARVHFVAKVGKDALGTQLQRTMQRHGVRTYLKKDARCATGTTVALGLATGQRHFLSCLPNNQTLAFRDLDLTALKACQHLLRADVWFSRDMLETGNERLLAKARAQGLTTSLDINFDPVWSMGPAANIRKRKRLLRRVLPYVDLAHGNIRELCEFTDAPDLPAALRRLTDWGVGAVIVHLGAKGAGYYCRGEWIVEPANRARHTIHATGTGDVLSMCMILLHASAELSIRRRLKISNRIVREFMEGNWELIPILAQNV
jgi:sugar/nucleoside kinase (ribokinase family)